MKFMVNSALLHDATVQRMPGRTFAKKFKAAILNGEENEFSRFLRPWKDPRPWKGAPWIALRAEIFERDGYTCHYCGERGGRLECDHVVPVSKGGETTHENLVTACFTCNRSKGALTVEEWRGTE